MTAQSANLLSLLKYNKEEGIGYFPCDKLVKVDSVYNQEYFDKYVGYAETDLGLALTTARIEFVKRHYEGPLVDIGIGCGQFIEHYGNEGYGYDVNPIGINWLNSRDKLWDPYQIPCFAATFWDSLEHIKDPKPLINNIQKWLFISIPLFKDYQDIVTSKHFRPDEHYWYFNRHGLQTYLWNLGFRLVSYDDFEIRAGRSQIYTFAFRRKN